MNKIEFEDNINCIIIIIIIIIITVLLQYCIL